MKGSRSMYGWPQMPQSLAIERLEVSARDQAVESVHAVFYRDVTPAPIASRSDSDLLLGANPAILGVRQIPKCVHVVRREVVDERCRMKVDIGDDPRSIARERPKRVAQDVIGLNTQQE